MSVFDGNAATLLETARRIDSLRKMVDDIRARRYSQGAASFEALLWLAVANAMCEGAKLGIAELQAECAK